jgi:hypothetical protein
MVLWGDSHAEAVSFGIEPNEMFTIFVVAHPGCPPAIDVIRADRSGSFRNCSDFETLRTYADVVLISRWTLYQRGLYKVGELQANTHFLASPSSDRESVGPAQSAENLAYGVQKAVADLRDRTTVHILRQVPDMQMLSISGLAVAETADIAPIRAWHAEETALLEKLGNTGVNIIDTWQTFCSEVECQLRVDHKPVYRDDNHVSEFGANLVYHQILQVVTRTTGD